MMNVDTALSEKMDIVIKTVHDLNTNDHELCDDHLTSLLKQTYQKILPAIAKLFVKEDQFLAACMKKKAYIKNNVNKLKMRNTLSLV